MNHSRLSDFWGAARKWLIFGCIAAAVVILVMAVRSFIEDGDGQTAYVYYTVSKADLPIIVAERGSLRSQKETTIRCEVENVGVDRSGNYGTQIIFIVPNGSAVEEGELLIELDSSAIRDRLDQQELSLQKAISAKTQAIARYDNQLIANETAIAEAKLKVELAELELEMYKDPDSGTLQLDKETIEREIDDVNNTIMEARMSLELAKVQRSGMAELFKLGYRGKTELDQTRLSFLKNEGALSSSLNRLNTKQANLRKLTEYESRMQEMRLQGAVDTAGRGQRQVDNDNISLEAQALAAKEEAETTEEKERERLERYETQLVNCKIYAPHDGMVVYADDDRRGGSEIAEGSTVRERQRLISLPDLSVMQVNTQVHEAVLDQVSAGLAVSVRVDAFPDKVFRGTVDQVAVVPSGTWGGAIKTYDTVVKIDGLVEHLKPGMTAAVEIHVDRIPKVLTVPVQAVMQKNRDNWCYVAAKNGIERRPIKLGRSNEKFIHITEGLAVGDRVVLNPMDVLEESESEAFDIAPDADIEELPAADETVASNDGKGSSDRKAKAGNQPSVRPAKNTGTTGD